MEREEKTTINLKNKILKWNDGSGDEVQATYDSLDFVKTFMCNGNFKVVFNCPLNRTFKRRKMNFVITEDITVTVKNIEGIDRTFDCTIEKHFPVMQAASINRKSPMYLSKKNNKK